jgi:outer membrane protein assembly factor BamD (BamD/ComL family)
MKKVFTLSVMLASALSLGASASFAQGRAKTGPDPATIRDSELEKDSLHNLEVARHYFKLKKAYLAALMRCEEIDAGNPNFAKLDEVLYIAGVSSLRLAESGGRQKTKVVLPDSMLAKDKQDLKYKTPEELRVDARAYFSRLLEEYPNSAFRGQAETELRALGTEPSTALPTVEPPRTKPPQ